MSDTIEPVPGSASSTPFNHNFTASFLTSHIHTGADYNGVYPRLITHEAVQIRANAIADNLDEVLMLPQGRVYQFGFLQRLPRQLRVMRTKKREPLGSRRKKRDQHEFFDEFNEYNNGYP